MIRKLQFKFVLINMLTVTVMLCAILGLIYHFTCADLEDESIRMMRAIAADPFSQGRPGDPGNDLRLPYFTLQLSPRGDLVSTGGGYYDLSDQKLLQSLITQSMASRQETGTLPEHDLRFCRVSSPLGTVLVFSDMSSENNTLSHLLQTLVFIGIFGFLVFLGISMLLARWAVRPVAAAWQQQRQFVADASHELKTPLTVILTNAELLRGATDDPERQQSFSRSILLMGRQMQRLVESLLELARSDAGQSRESLRPVELSELVLDAAIAFDGVFAEKGLSLDSQAEPGIVVSGEAQALRQVTDILLDNARKYSAPGGQTILRLYSCGQGKCRLQVSNPGPEIPREELRRIFQRFYRLDKARGRDGSFGLGLSIAEAIVTRHRGRIWAESRNGCNTFFVELRRG